jgi:uncharacterized protein YdhG (YjbR/CyaY superfamily)
MSGFPESTQKILEQIRKTIHDIAPEAVETISYGIPTFDIGKKHLIHFAAYEHHVGLYPGSNAIAVFSKELSKYKTSKGAVQFPIGKPIPYDLIIRITKHCVEQRK